jgi:hypothetical protein
MSKKIQKDKKNFVFKASKDNHKCILQNDLKICLSEEDSQGV